MVQYRFDINGVIIEFIVFVHPGSGGYKKRVFNCVKSPNKRVAYVHCLSNIHVDNLRLDTPGS